MAVGPLPIASIKKDSMLAVTSSFLKRAADGQRYKKTTRKLNRSDANFLSHGRGITNNSLYTRDIALLEPYHGPANKVLCFTIYTHTQIRTFVQSITESTQSFYSTICRVI